MASSSLGLALLMGSLGSISSWIMMYRGFCGEKLFFWRRKRKADGWQKGWKRVFWEESFLGQDGRGAAGRGQKAEGV